MIERTDIPEDKRKRVLSTQFDAVFFARLDSSLLVEFAGDLEIRDTDKPDEIADKQLRRVRRLQAQISRYNGIREGINQPFFRELEGALIDVVDFIDHKWIWECKEKGDKAAEYDAVCLRKGIMQFFESYGSISNKLAAKVLELEQLAEKIKAGDHPTNPLDGLT